MRTYHSHGGGVLEVPCGAGSWDWVPAAFWVAEGRGVFPDIFSKTGGYKLMLKKNQDGRMRLKR